MFKEKSLEYLPVSLELANKVWNLPPVPGDRRLVSERMERIKKKLQTDDDPKPFEWAIAYVKENDTWYRVNGQHTSKLFIDGFPLKGKVVFQQWECDTINDLLRLYAIYDSKISARTNTNIKNVFIASNPVLSSIGNMACVTNALSAVFFSKHGDLWNKVSPEEKHTNVTQQDEDFVVWSSKVLRAKELEHKGFFLAALQTYKDNKAKAETFWSEVQTGNIENPNSATRGLREYMLSREKHCDMTQIACCCLHAWKAFLAERSITQKQLKRIEKGWQSNADIQGLMDIPNIREKNVSKKERGN